MEFTKQTRIETEDVIFTLVISNAEMRQAKIYASDIFVLRELNEADDVTISDQLLGLELLARRIEEGEAIQVGKVIE